jgi:8-oxo-dGTP diphosphatase
MVTNKTQKNATVAVIHDNHLLLLKRGDTAPWMPNKYCLPGGGVEPNESLVHAASRELYEETRIVVMPKNMQSITVNYRNNNKIVFVTTVTSAKVVLNFEHSDYVWATIRDIVSYKIVPGLSATILTLIHYKFLK